MNTFVLLYASVSWHAEILFSLGTLIGYLSVILLKTSIYIVYLKKKCNIL